jgi:hypothetical protein
MDPSRPPPPAAIGHRIAARNWRERERWGGDLPPPEPRSSFPLAVTVHRNSRQKQEQEDTDVRVCQEVKFRAEEIPVRNQEDDDEEDDEKTLDLSWIDGPWTGMDNVGRVAAERPPWPLGARQERLQQPWRLGRSLYEMRRRWRPSWPPRRRPERPQQRWRLRRSLYEMRRRWRPLWPHRRRLERLQQWWRLGHSLYEMKRR